MKTARKPTYAFWAGILTALAAALITSMTPALARADVTETEEHEFTLTDGGRFSLTNVNGSIHIQGVSGDQVKIVATKKAGSQKYLDAMKIIIDATDRHISVETRYPDSDDWSLSGDNSGSVSYEITVPVNTELDDIETVNGEVEVSNVAGAVSVESVNGELELSNLKGDVTMDTVNGTIAAQFDELGGRQRVKADAVNGRIVLSLPANASAQVTAETINGSIDADDFGLAEERGFVGRDLQGQIGAGEARINLETVNGSIDLKKNP